MATLFKNPAVGRSDEIHSTQKNPLGYRGLGTDGTEWIYLAGVASCVAGSCVTYGSSYTAVLSVTGARGAVAFAGAAILAANWGWFQIYGAATADFNGAAVAAAKLYSASTGKVDDAVVSGDQISGAVVAATVSGSGAGSVMLTYPRMDGLG